MSIFFNEKMRKNAISVSMRYVNEIVEAVKKQQISFLN